MRTILFSGKGGVGKTTISCATALEAARRGKKVMLISTDLAHNIADILEADPGQKEWQADDNLWVKEVDVISELGELWTELKIYLADLLQYFGFQTLMEEEAILLPGVAEFFSLSSVLSAVDDNNFDLVVVDCGPTADTMRMLGFADTASERIHRFLKLQRTIISLLRPFKSRVEVPLPNDDALSELGPLADRAARIKQIITDPGETSIRLVMNPDALSISESRRLFTYLCLFNMPVDAVIVNKVLPDSCADGFLGGHYERQSSKMDEIEKSFSMVKILESELSRDEMSGPEMLRRLGGVLYNEVNPSSLLSEPVSYKFEKGEDGTKYLFVPLPLSDKENISIKQQGPHLMIKVENNARIITVPDSLAGMEVTSAKVKDGKLELTFL
jgi:arsenite/tail-anchored protein-transporting ATPase